MPTTGPVDGIARKVSLSFVFVSVIGWLVFTVFFGFTINRYSNRIDVSFLPHWCFMVTGVFLYTNLIISLVINGRWYTDTTIHFFNALYLAAGGATFYTDWTTYYSLYNQDVRFMFELGGCALAGLCLTFSIMMWPCFTNVRVRNALIADADPKVATPVRESTSQSPLAMVNLSSVGIEGTNAKIVDPEEEDEYASLTDMQDSTTDYKQHLQSPTSPERMGAHFQAQDEGNYVINQLDAQEEGHYVINKLDAPDEGDYVINKLDAPEEGHYVINKLDAQEEGDYVINKFDGQEGEYSEVSLVVHEPNHQQQEL